VPPSGQVAAQAGTSAAHADSVVLVVLVLEIVGAVVDDGDGALLLVDDAVVDGDAALVLVVDDVVVTAPVPSGAQSICTAWWWPPSWLQFPHDTARRSRRRRGPGARHLVGREPVG
jgi:hypothetical protein